MKTYKLHIATIYYYQRAKGGERGVRRNGYATRGTVIHACTFPKKCLIKKNVHKGIPK